MKAIKLRISDLIQHPSHKRLYSLRNIEELADSIDRTGLLVPIIINRKNQVLSGWRRVLAAKALKWKDIAVVYNNDTPPADEVRLIIDSNSQRIKTLLEKWNEIKELRKLWSKKPGERTDMNPNLSAEDKKHTKDRIASAIGISVGNVHKIERIAAEDKALFALIDKGEISIHEAYNRCSDDTPEAQTTGTEPAQSTPAASGRNSAPKPLEKLYAHTCPHCGEKFND